MPEPEVSGYKIHWGTQSGVYTHSQDAGNATDAVVSEFMEGVEYFTAISAYSATGEESDYSAEISFVYDSSDRLILLEAEDGALTAPNTAPVEKKSTICFAMATATLTCASVVEAPRCGV